MWGRFSSPYRPAGKIAVELAGRTATVDIASTTSHDAFMPQELIDSIELAAGQHTYFVRIDPVAYQNFNLDYLQFDRITDDQTAQAPSTVGGVVAGTLSLTLGAMPSFGVFQPAVAGEYTAQTTARVISVGAGHDAHRDRRQAHQRRARARAAARRARGREPVRAADRPGRAEVVDRARSWPRRCRSGSVRRSAPPSRSAPGRTRRR